LAPLLQIKDLTVDIAGKRVLDGVDIEPLRGKVTAIVGESGSGKTMTALSVLDLLPEEAVYVRGEVSLDGRNIRHLPARQKRQIRGNTVAMVFQEPFTALDPVMKCGEQVLETIRAHRRTSRGRAREQVLELFEKVRLVPDAYDMYSFELSGGMRQRVMLAAGLCCDPEILILDEPTTALDVSVQKEILDLTLGIQRQRSLTVLFITHDLSVVNYIADMIYVMRKGRVVEKGPKKKIITHPEHDYTRHLLDCVPRLGDKRERLPGPGASDTEESGERSEDI
jgi:ABC-type glutathione transport system ATPase component